MANDSREPEVSGRDVGEILKRHIREDDDAALIAEKANCSSRTIWRIVGQEMEWLTLKRADDLLTAVGDTINNCHLKLADGTVEEPWFGE